MAQAKINKGKNSTLIKVSRNRSNQETPHNRLRVN